MSSDSQTRPSATSASTPTETRRRRGWSPLRLVVGFLVGILLGAGVWMVVLTIVYRDSMPDLTAEALREALNRWEANAPDSYDLQLVISGRRPGEVHVEVRDGQVTAMTREGVTPSQRRVWEYWRVEGMFDTLARDLDLAEDPTAGFGAPAGSRAILKAEFDPEYGVPLRYRRVVSGSDLSIEWEVTLFEPR